MERHEEKLPDWNRLIDYCLVIGSENQGEDLLPVQRLVRSNSHAIQPICNMILVTDERDKPPDFQVVKMLNGEECNLGQGSLMRNKIFLCESRLPAEQGRGSTVQMPVTSIDAIINEKKEQPQKGFTRCQGSLTKAVSNKGLSGKGALYIERDLLKDPVIDVKIIDTKKGETCPAGWTLLDKCLNGDGKLSKMKKKKPSYFLIYRKAERKVRDAIAYQAGITDRFPKEDYPDFKCEVDGIAMLCFPRGLILEDEPILPSFLTFVMTQQDGREIHGASLTFYEELNPNCPTIDEHPMFVPKAVCILSHWPYYRAFHTVLIQLYRTAMSPSPLPIERYLGHLMMDVPTPCRSYETVQYQIGHETVTFSRRPEMGLPCNDISLLPLFQHLDVANIITVFEHILAEGKVVFISHNFEHLNPVAESFRELLFPLKWQQCFIPILPSNLSYTIRAPVPFVVGTHRSFIDEVEIPADVLIVDLDHNSLRLPRLTGEDGEVQVVGLPQSVREELHKELAEYDDLHKAKSGGDVEPSSISTFIRTGEHEGDMDEDAVKVAFLRQLVRFLADYRQFVLLVEDTAQNCFDLSCMFDMEGYVENLAPEMRAFGQQFRKTQMFADFVLSRVSVTPRHEELLFFDWCVALSKQERRLPNNNSNSFPARASSVGVGGAPAGGSGAIRGLTASSIKAMAQMRPRLYPSRVTADLRQRAHPFVNENSVYVCPPPSDENLQGEGPYCIDIFPKLNHELFGTPHRESVHAQTVEVAQSSKDYRKLELQEKSMAIVRSLYSVLPERIQLLKQEEQVSLQASVRDAARSNTGAVYTLWFLLFAQQRQNILRRTNKACMPQGKTEADIKKAIAVRAERERDALGDLVVILRQLHNMIAMAAAIPSNQVLLAVCRFCVHEGLTTPFEVFYRLLAPAIPSPLANFFHRLAQTGLEIDSGDEAKEPESTVVHELPDSIHTQCTCGSCGLELSGEEIIGGWLNKQTQSSTACPICESPVKPELVVRHPRRKEPLKVLYVKPARISTLIQQELKDSDGGSNELNPLEIVRRTEHLFWNCFFDFVMRGNGEGQMPFMFLFRDERAASEPYYTVETRPHKPWGITRGARATTTIEVEPSRSPLTKGSTGEAPEFVFNDRDGKLRASVAYIMKNVTTDKVQRAVREFLTGRMQLKESKAITTSAIKDVDVEFFNASMYRQLALLHPTGQMYVRAFAREYRDAIAWLDSSIAKQKRAMEQLASTPTPPDTPAGASTTTPAEVRAQREAQTAALGSALQEWINLREQMQPWDECPTATTVEAGCAALELFGSFQFPDGGKNAVVAEKCSPDFVVGKKGRKKGGAVQVPPLREVLNWHARNEQKDPLLTLDGFLSFVEHVADESLDLDVPVPVRMYARHYTRFWLSAKEWRAMLDREDIRTLPPKEAAKRIGSQADDIYDTYFGGTLARSPPAAGVEGAAPVLDVFTEAMLEGIQRDLSHEEVMEVFDPLMGTKLADIKVRALPPSMFEAAQDAAFAWLQEHAHAYWATYVVWRSEQLAAERSTQQAKQAARHAEEVEKHVTRQLEAGEQDNEQRPEALETPEMEQKEPVKPSHPPPVKLPPRPTKKAMPFQGDDDSASDTEAAVKPPVTNGAEPAPATG